MPAFRSTYYYATQIIVLSTPFIIIPFLARVVGPSGLGLYGIGQGVALIASSFVEYGFILSASRWLAKNTHDSMQVKQIVRQVVGAKLLLTVVCIGAAAFCFPLLRFKFTNLTIVYLAITLGIFQGHNPYWFFGGTNKILFVGTIDVVSKLLGVILILVLVRSPTDVWLVFLAQIMAQVAGVAFAVLSSRPLRMGILSPDFRGGRQLLRRNADIFLQNILGNFYSGATALIMGFVSSAHIVGYFAGAERLARAAMLPMVPLRQTFFPSTVLLATTDQQLAARRVRRILIITLMINFFGFLILFFCADLIVHVALGPRFSESAKVLRFLGIVPLSNAATDVLSTLWLLPHHRDRYCTMVVLTTTIIHVVLVCSCALLWGAVGAGFAVLASTSFALLCMFQGVLRLRPSLFGPGC